MKISFKNKELNLNSPAVMGILNITPDSFYDGGRYLDDGTILSQVEKMISEGADIIDIGACSTRPNAIEVTEAEELKRIIPIIKLVRKKFPNIIISADTFRSNVAEQAVEEGTDMINDISGGTMDMQMFDTISKLQVPYILSHLQGTPKTMQINPVYKDVFKEVEEYFSNKISQLHKKGFKKIILDPGFGFGKTLSHNYTLLKKISGFQTFQLPLMAGISRKRMICQALAIKTTEALNGTTAANTIALMYGANLLRVHDVKEAKEAVKIFNFTQNQ